MKYYLGDRLLFIDMHQNYTHCIVEGEDRVLCCQKTPAEAERVCCEIIAQRSERLNEMKRVLDKGHAYTKGANNSYGADIKELYPTSGLLFGAIKRMEKMIRSIRVAELRKEP